MLTSELLSSNILFKDGRKPSCSKNIPRSLESEEKASSVPKCHSLISPKTLLNNSEETLWGQNSRINTGQAAAGHSATFTVNSSQVLCSTTVSCFSHLPQSNQTFQTGVLHEEKDTEVLVEAEERCSSYDDVVLEHDDADHETDKEWNPEFVSDFDSECCEWDDHLRTSEVNVALEDNVGGHVSTRDNLRMQNDVGNTSLVSKCIRTKETRQHSTMSESKRNFAVPHVIDWGQLNQSNTGHLASPQLQLKLVGPHKSVQTNIVSSVWSKPFRPENTSTPNTSTSRHKPDITKHPEPLKSPFTVYTETKKQATGFSHPSPHTPNILSSLSTNKLSCCTSRKGPQRITSPLCACGRRAKRQVVTNGGPNQGRGFYSCSVRRSGGRGRVEKGCGFFKWESALMKGSSVDLSSKSLCQVNSTLHLAPTRKSC